MNFLLGLLHVDKQKRLSWHKVRTQNYVSADLCAWITTKRNKTLPHLSLGILDIYLKTYTFIEMTSLTEKVPKILAKWLLPLVVTLLFFTVWCSKYWIHVYQLVKIIDWKTQRKNKFSDRNWLWESAEVRGKNQNST